MPQEKKLSRTEQIQLERTPKRAKVDKKDLSTFKMKDEHFEGRFITYLSQSGDKEGKVPAVHRNISIARQTITCYPGEFLTKDDAGVFDKGARDHWLVDSELESKAKAKAEVKLKAEQEAKRKLEDELKAKEAKEKAEKEAKEKA